MEYSDSIPGRNLSLYVSLSVLSTMAVVLRVISRIKTKNTLKGDDWWACLGLILLQVFLGISIWVIIKKIRDAGSSSGTEAVFKAMYVAAPITISTITAAKVSVILLYRRVFLIDNAFRVASNIVGVLCLLWWISFVFTVLFQCTPVQKSWKLEIPGHCVDGGLGFLLSESLSCVLDFAIILLPVRVIRKMKLPLAQKIMLCFIFIMGSFVGVISILRMAIVSTTNSIFPTPVYMNGRTNWLPIQLAMAVICCCLPTYRPLLPNGTAIKASLVGLYSSIGSLIPRKRRSAISNANGSHNVDNEPSRRSRPNYYNLSGHGEESGITVLTNAVGTEAEQIEDYVPGRDLPMNDINVTRTVDMV